ncbi:hypothetical protein LEP1GSC188_4565 [Leptospira weilii serovar Topaz str. LT2116]|uniref:Uncharacterized protein n=1 Tax=Leptospira weilii serovar Topaz str. LT2116 TaxID=1088540 RepID=M3FSL1_9LEPT|nr:hypothetical protein LEP1GSC188_4565 [Leptospira weilii serovar Topaz str. LT2116]
MQGNFLFFMKEFFDEFLPSILKRPEKDGKFEAYFKILK